MALRRVGSGITAVLWVMWAPGFAACSTSSKPSTCSAGAACVPLDPCHAGVTRCQGGVAACVDAGTPGPDGTPCGTALVCSAGTCIAACQPNVSCTPGGTPEPCQVYQTSCASKSSTAACGRAGNVVDGTSCGPSLVCSSGSCAAPSAGCGAVSPPTGTLALSAQVGGVMRAYEVLVSPGYLPWKPLPLVFVFPQGIDFTENGLDYGVGWNEHCGGYDMPFFDAMLEHLSAAYCIDLRRIFAAGFSWGGDFVNNLGCCRGDRVRAVASASGADGDYNPACTSSMPALRTSYADPDVYPQSAFALTVALYRTAHGCGTGAADPVSPAPCVAYRDCDAPVVECRYPGLGHQFPPNWSNDVWAWFASIP